MKWVASLRETRHQLREAEAGEGSGRRRRRRFGVAIGSWLLWNVEEAFRQSGAGGGATETGLRWRRESQWTPNAESIFAVNCFCRVRGLARFE